MAHVLLTENCHLYRFSGNIRYNYHHGWIRLAPLVPSLGSQRGVH